MKKTYFSPRTRYVDLSTESSLLDMSMPVVRDDDEGVGHDGVLTHKQNDMWNSWSEDK